MVPPKQHGNKQWSLEETQKQLYDISSSERAIEEQITEIVEVVRECFGVVSGFVSYIDPETEYWEVLQASGGALESGVSRDLTTTFCSDTIERESPLALHDVSERAPEEGLEYNPEGMKCYLGTKIMVDGDVYGTLCFVSPDPRKDEFTTSELLIAELAAKIIGSKLAQRRQEVEIGQKEQLLSVYSRVLRHNLRNDLTTVKGMVNLVATIPDEDEKDQARSKANTAIDGLLELAENTRELQEILNADSELEEFILPGQLHELVEQVAVDYSFDSITIDADEAVLTVLPMFKEALREVLRNSLKHTGDDVEVSITAEKTDDDVVIEVYDSGPGLPEHEQIVLRQDRETPLSHATGIGLWLVKWIIESHGGEINISTETGTCIELQLPQMRTVLTENEVTTRD